MISENGTAPWWAFGALAMRQKDLRSATPSTTAARVGARTETKEEMRRRHAEELRRAGFGAAAGDELPQDDDPDPDAPPPELDFDEQLPPGSDDDDEPDHSSEDREDEAARRQPNDDMRRARHAKLRRKRRALAIARERRRCASIFQDPAAARNTPLAAQLAFGTNLSAARAIALLRVGGRSGSLSERMARYAASTAAIGAGAHRWPSETANGVAASWDAVMKKAGRP